MKAIIVKFENESYNYVTSVNPKLTKKDIKDYFVGKKFNVGAFPVEDFQKCTGIDFVHFLNNTKK